MESWQAKFTPEDVLRQGPWLRALSRALVGEAAADDVSQETWLRAARKSDLDPARLRPFLGGILRRVASEWRREARRRVAREGAHERREEAPSEQEVVERLELQELVVRAVRELDEPYRRTLTLRYLEGLSGAEIARRERLPEATVRTRVAHGLELLRQRLDARAGGRSSWRLALLPLARQEPIATGIATTGVLTVMGMKSGAAIAALALVAWWVWPRQREGVSEARPEVAEAGKTPGQDSATGAPSAAVREELGAPARAVLDEPTREPAHEARQEASLLARVVDFEGLPVEGAELSAPALRGVRATSTADGRVELPLPGVEPGPLRLRVRAEHFVGREVTVEVARAERAWAGELALERGATLRGRVLAPDGSHVARARLFTARGTRLAPPELGPSPEELAAWPGTTSDGEGRFEFEPLEPGRWSLWATAAGRPWIRLDDLPLVSGVRDVDVRLAELDLARTVAGRVLTPERRPAAAARLVLRMEDGDVLEAQADVSGHFDFMTRDEHVRCRLEARDAEWRYAPREVELQAGVTDLELCFEAPLELALRVLAPDGAPLEGAGVHACDAQRALVPGCDGRTDAEGAARLRVPDATFQLLVERAGHAPRLFGPFEPRALPASLELVLPVGQAIRGRVTHQGQGVVGASVALRRAADEGTWFAPRAWPFASEPALDALEPASAREQAVDARGEFVLAPPDGGAELERWYLVASARDLAPRAFGPFARTELLAQVHELPLTRGGTLTGRLSRSVGGSPEGCLVWARNGLGAQAFATVGPGGTYLLEHLLAGAWQVRALPPLSRDSLGLLDRPTSERPVFDVVVDEEHPTRLDLVLREPPEVRVTGRLDVDADPPGAWTVELRARGESFARQESVYVALAPDGSFHACLRCEDAVLLTFRSVDPRWEDLAYEVEVATRDGRARCERRLSFARLAGEFPHLGGRTLWVARLGAEPCTTAIQLDSSGAWTERWVPSGTVQCLDGEPGREGTTTLATLTLAPGQAGRIER